MLVRDEVLSVERENVGKVGLESLIFRENSEVSLPQMNNVSLIEKVEHVFRTYLSTPLGFVNSVYKIIDDEKKSDYFKGIYDRLDKLRADMEEKSCGFRENLLFTSNPVELKFKLNKYTDNFIQEGGFLPQIKKSVLDFIVYVENNVDCNEKLERRLNVVKSSVEEISTAIDLVSLLKFDENLFEGIALLYETKRAYPNDEIISLAVDSFKSSLEKLDSGNYVSRSGNYEFVLKRVPFEKISHIFIVKDESFKQSIFDIYLLSDLGIKKRSSFNYNLKNVYTNRENGREVRV